MMGREPLPTLGNVSWHLAGHYKIIVLDPSLPRHGRCWAKPIQSGHAVQRKRCGSLNRSFSYPGSRPAPPNPSSDPREASPGTSQATSGSLQALIGGVPVPSRIQLSQRNGVAKMKWVLRRPLGRAFSSKILGMKVSHENNIAQNHLGGSPTVQHRPQHGPTGGQDVAT